MGLFAFLTDVSEIDRPIRRSKSNVKVGVGGSKVSPLSFPPTIFSGTFL